MSPSTSSYPPTNDRIFKPMLPPLPQPRSASPYEDQHHPLTSLPPHGPSRATPPPPQLHTSQPPSTSSVAQSTPPLPPAALHSPLSQAAATPPPPPPSTQPAPAAAAPPPSTDGSGYRPLNVRDALSYLDQVKVQFSEQPDVYNRFLDIMKDFKSQAIDTPGVIERVSTLFKGHPMLISGFNTFLPPGYRIECSTDPMEPDVIRVTTPNGTTTTMPTSSSMDVDYYPPASTPQQQQQQKLQHHQLQQLPPSQQQQQQRPPLPPPYGTPAPPPVSGMPPLPRSMPQPPAPSSATVPPPSSSHSPYPSRHLPPPPTSTILPPSASASSSQYVPHGRPPPSTIQPAEGSPTLPSSPLQNGKRSPVEFNHAINYVNKIKNRFANEPDTYKQFLEILQTYQKEQKPIQEVYTQVQQLFNGNQDLLDEFKQFLPDITGEHAPPPSLYADYYDDPYKRDPKKKRVPVPNSTLGKRSKMYHPKHADMEGLRSDPYAFPASPFDPAHPTVSAEEVELFERIRKYIGNKPSYEEFLKTLNLYTNQIVTMDQLMDQVRTFIGGNAELFDWFQSVLAYEPKHKPIHRPLHLPAKPDLIHCATIADSPSYRIAPVEWRHQACSGRDQLAWEVLNDVYVSHPIWASEDDGFVASKKSQYEEAMHRCEEERYDYNMVMEANLNTIALLEPIAKKIETMTPEEKIAFRLKPGLGGQTISIYERIIKKVYEKDRGVEIIELLYENPAQVVPILLKRLHQKDEEWHKAQREWNKIWRELDNKNYYRALDYQGITFKGNDRKAMTLKAMTSEIETLYKNKKIKQAGKNVSTKLHVQFMFAFPDESVFQDAVRVIYSYIDRQSGFTHHDRDKVRTFLRSFLPVYFGVDNVEPEGLQPYSDHEDDEIMDEDDDGQSTNTEDSDSDARSPSSSSTSRNSPSTRRHRSRRGRNQEDDHTMDLLRDVLTKNSKAENGAMAPPTTHNTTDASQGTSAEAMDVDVPPSATVPSRRATYHFFCNTNFYAFFRLFEMIYGRLLRLKKLDEAQAKTAAGYDKKPNKGAMQLGLYTTKYDAIDTSEGFYKVILTMIDRFFEGEMEVQMFEDFTRHLFVTDAYILFTIDKLIHTFVKQIQSVTVDTDSVELIRLFQSDKALATVSPRTLSVYRLRAEEIVGADENLYLINFEPKTRVMSMQLVGNDDYMLEPSKEDRYEHYVHSYMDWTNATEGVNAEKIKTTFLQRNLPEPEPAAEEDKQDARPLENNFYLHSRLQHKIDQDTYHMYYIEGSEDVFSRTKPSTSQPSDPPAPSS
ncbi:hypothetical protein DM01DRAFT_1301529 [Hesseltinella vesiculosa]|uniref:Histone deacetylase interacting domain-containing protein n=1 Tax=Hesseltinella vesiculosa TaxID=101127 RepID=A0A1X2GQ04_9FUNG|nr:hypothetical protein DM01DRAFT_1301529 [Hesseltinella vesiculosa]